MRQFNRVARAGALCAALAAGAAQAAPDKVVIGDIDDMSGPYGDVIGAGGVEAIRMAIADFGGSVLGKPIDVLTADHQNKPDIGQQKFREWADTQGMTMTLGGSNTGVSLAMSAAAKEKKIPFFAIGAAGAQLTGKACNPYTIHYGYDTKALANGTAKTIVAEGGKSWFFITADYAFGKQLEADASDIVKAGGGSVVGDVRVPLGTSDFSSYLLQAQGSGAQVLGLSNAGADFSNSLKAASEFGLTKSMKPAALLVFLTDIRSVGLETAQGLILTDGWYWDLDDRTRAFAKRFYDKVKREPTMPQAAFYSATLTYLSAVKAAGTTDGDKVMDELHKMTINDAFTQNGTIRPDGLLLHDMYIMQVKTPAESKGEWDYYKLVKTMTGEEAYGKLSDSACPLVQK
ncbi:amino acid/amide ABC transporter substrate-binding protein (HAAT family) [Roseiarcus fermentans]|uniref:Amino acid/amide ABC transporter substrate-binding protein (HAAT family) n=1 Tax=Roseiarcus fermentans TaxID=1473586 RepID=A0A366F4C7_9HYPH|nr:ABC transporter substrate-binding protein [Roseiarcus fermentans]RBP08619.1 amino acid/amide ABC transporter substrate-binding protein (HAAT family) [Roseiarcus fermentans]